MIKAFLDYTSLIHLTKVVANSTKQKITYYFDGKIETQTFADSSEFDDAVSAIENGGFILIGSAYYNIARLSIAEQNAATVTYQFVGNVVIAHEYDSASDAEEAIATLEDSFFVINGKYYNASQMVVANTNPAALEIVYDFGGEQIKVVYEDTAAYEEAEEKLASVSGIPGGGGGSPVQKKVATPKLTPAGGEVDSGTTVTITCATDGATIHYTTDGTDPTSSSPTYSSPVAVPSGGITIKAMAVKAEMKDSGIATGVYTVATEKVAAPTFSPAAGAVTIGTKVAIASATDGATIHYTTDGSTPTTSSPVYSEEINIDEAKTIKAFAVKEGMDNSNVSSAAYTIIKVANPSFSPSASQIESGTQITISCSTAGATIYYTDDGSEPSTSSTEYTGPITFTATKTFKAIAVKEGCTNSGITTKAYTLKVVQYAYAGIYNNPEEPEEPSDFMPTNSDVTSEWLNNLTNVNKFVATKKEYGSLGDEKTFSGIDQSVGGRVVYAYPASFGDITSYIQNGSTQAIGNSFEKLTNTVDGVEYNCYVLRTWNVSSTGSLNYAFI